MQSGYGRIEITLHGDDVWGVVFFRCLDGSMAQEELDGAEIRAILKQPDTEGVAEAVRVAVRYSRELHDLRERSANAADSGIEDELAVPEEMGRVRREFSQGCYRNFREADIERGPGLHHADEELAGSHVEGVTAKLDRVGDAQAGIEQREHDGSGSGIGDIAAGLEDVIDLFCAKREGRHAVCLRRFQTPPRVLGDPLAVEAEAKEAAHDHDFLHGREGRDLGSSGAEAGQRVEVDACETVPGKGVR
jgi:hypothetical protein